MSNGLFIVTIVLFFGGMLLGISMGLQERVSHDVLIEKNLGFYDSKDASFQLITLDTAGCKQ